MIRLILVTALTLSGGSGFAQSVLTTASPIPEGAEMRFCYYDGRAYSKNSYIVVSGKKRQLQTSDNNGALNGGNELRAQDNTKLLHCVKDDDGIMIWKSSASITIGD
ncbi:hypothetical protein K3727_17000 [Rhodobacteraceae bacterium M382]|nr:hypothetical protein K3727_17000 [Rhodobacteraceae bacterium M382]